MFSSLENYTEFVYSLAQRYPAIRLSTLVLIPLGTTFASLRGDLHFEKDITLRVVEEIDFLDKRIEYYSYSVSQSGERLYWYDPQPHPDVPSLQRTHPHHKHVPPDIKHNRVPAPELSFEAENLPFLIEEVLQILGH